MCFVGDDQIPRHLFSPGREGIAPRAIVIDDRDERPPQHLGEFHLLRCQFLFLRHGANVLIETDDDDRDSNVAFELRDPDRDDAQRADNQRAFRGKRQDQHAGHQRLTGSHTHGEQQAEHPQREVLEAELKGGQLMPPRARQHPLWDGGLRFRRGHGRQRSFLAGDGYLDLRPRPTRAYWRCAGNQKVKLWGGPDRAKVALEQDRGRVRGGEHPGPVGADEPAPEASAHRQVRERRLHKDLSGLDPHQGSLHAACPFACRSCRSASAMARCTTADVAFPVRTLYTIESDRPQIRAASSGTPLCRRLVRLRAVFLYALAIRFPIAVCPLPLDTPRAT